MKSNNTFFNEGGEKMQPADMNFHDILFRTKLNIPYGNKSAVLRPRIMSELNNALKVKLTLITAPAGFGKTTAAACWAMESGTPAAWFSIDSHDNNVKKFWSYAVAALDTVIPGLEGMFSPYLDTADNFTPEGLVAALVEEISKTGTDFLLVLDDYHLIQDAAIHESLFMFIKYIPSNAHVIISGRSKPPFVSERFGISGDMKEMGIKELRFDSSETEALSKTYDMMLSKSELNLLEKLIEGWAVGLRLIFDSLCRENRFSIRSLISGSGWDSHKIAAYLMEEVINHCTEEDKTFMLKTSILSQINGPLCDELTGRTDGTAVLKRLSQSNAFIAPVDNEGDWYRYHPIFSEFLQNMIKNSDTLSAAELHERAGDWYERNGYIDEAVSHFVKCEKMQKIVAIIEKYNRYLLKTGDFSGLKGWLAKLPVALVKNNDRLCLTYSWALMLSGSVKEAEVWMSVLEKKYAVLDEPPQDDILRKQIILEIFYYKSLAGTWTDDRESILFSIRKMKEMMDENISFDFGLNINTGEATLMAGMLGFRGRISLLDEYAPIYETARKDVIRKKYGYIPALTGEVLYERNQAEKAVPILIKALTEAEAEQMAGSLIPAEITLAKVMKSKGDISGAYDIIADAGMKLTKTGLLYFQPVLSAFRARIGIECEDNETVDKWLKNNYLDMHDTLSVRRIYEHITLARVLVFRKDYNNAALLLNRLLIFAQKDSNIYYTIEILNLLAISYHAAGQTQKAMISLRESLFLGEREGYERHFIEEGMVMSALLRRFLRLNFSKGTGEAPPISALYIRKLLAHAKEYCITIKTFIKRKESGSRISKDFTQPLTKREREILRFLSLEFTNPEIASTLDISINTVKVNCTNIYRKLDVKKREQAVSRARELNILQ